MHIARDPGRIGPANYHRSSHRFGSSYHPAPNSKSFPHGQRMGPTIGEHDTISQLVPILSTKTGVQLDPRSSVAAVAPSRDLAVMYNQTFAVLRKCRNPPVGRRGGNPPIHCQQRSFPDRNSSTFDDAFPLSSSSNSTNTRFAYLLFFGLVSDHNAAGL